jgi:hypothetical protein
MFHIRMTTAAIALMAAPALGLTGPAAAQTAEGQTQSSEQTQQQTGGDQAMEQGARDCLNRAQDLATQIGEQGMAVPNRAMQTLYDAAIVFAENGQMDACRSVVDGMQQFAETTGRPMDADAAERAGAMTPALESARPITEMQGTIQVGTLMDATVLSPSGEQLGDVDEVVMSADGQTRYLLIGRGGFLGMGEEFVPVELERFRMTENGQLVLDVPRGTFENAPTFETTAIGETVSEWRSEVGQWWETEVEGEAAESQ